MVQAAGVGKQVTRVAFTLIGGKNWTGGYHYLLNLLQLLVVHGTDRVHVVLFVGDDVAGEDVAPFVALDRVQIVRSALLNERRRLRSLGRSLALGADAPLRSLFRAHRVDAVFEAAQFFGRHLGIAAIAWIPDFQHHHLRHLFSTTGYWKRELGFRAQIAAGRRILLSSQDACDDCERAYPTTIGRTHVVRFAIPVRTPVGQTEARTVADQYGLPSRFFFMPNQFWQHKNHHLVVDALAILRDRKCETVVAASGKQLDPRNPQYAPQLLERVQRLGLGASFRALGLVPYGHLLALMRASTALLNPSTFEGWSTTVEEARSLGVPMILSRLRVHLEQASDAVFFDPRSAASLADALEGYRPLGETQRASMALSAAVLSEARARQFALDFIQVVERSTGVPGS
jgi:glycosyltransferase involved in cell wall biosynthesis